MDKTKKRVSLLAVFVCLIVLIFSFALAACNVKPNANTDEQIEATWYYGSAFPNDRLGKVGDYYLNTDNLSSYVKEENGWRAISMEEAGTWYYGTEKPVDSMGSKNDFYLNTVTGELYHKGGSAWGDPILTLKGNPGRDGVIWFSGDKNPNENDDPTLNDAMPGDFYLRYPEFEVYQLGMDKEWKKLGSIKGDKGDDAVDPVMVYNGKGKPEKNVKNPKEGDLYIGVFDGLDGKGAGSRLYRYIGGKWVELMSSVDVNQINIASMDQLIAFRDNVTGGKDYKGMEVHLKTDLDFKDPEAASFAFYLTEAVEPWTPIGTSDTPFRGTFDGEGHTIENFTVTTSETGTRIGFFGYVENATIEHLHFVNAEVTASGEGTFGAVVVGQVQNDLTVKDVTVTGSTVTAQGSAKVGGLVGKLEGSGEETTLTVEGSTFEGTGASDFVGDKGDVTVNITDSSITDETGTTSKWDEAGEQSKIYGVAEDGLIQNLMKEKNQEGGSLEVKLSGDVTLESSELKNVPYADPYMFGYTLGNSTSTASEKKKVDMTIDLAGHNLTLQSYQFVANNTHFQVIDAKAIRVLNGSSLTITDSSEKPGTLYLTCNGGSAITVSGNDGQGTASSVTIKNVNVVVKGTYISYHESPSLQHKLFSPGITASSGGVVNLLEGTHITAYDDSTDVCRSDKYNYDKLILYRYGYIVSVENGSSATYHSTLNIDGATVEVGGLITPFVAAGKYTDINFIDGTITTTSGKGSGVFVIDNGSWLDSGKSSSTTKCGTIRMKGGTINMNGSTDAADEKASSSSDQYMQAITDLDAAYGMVYISGGTINVAPTSGTAVAIGAQKDGSNGKKEYHVGGGVTINLNATGDGKAVAVGCASAPRVYVYKDMNIVVLGDASNNIEYYKQEKASNNGRYRDSMPQVGASSGVIDNRDKLMPENKK